MIGFARPADLVVFARGASLVPLDVLESRVSHAYLASVLRSLDIHDWGLFDGE